MASLDQNMMDINGPVYVPPGEDDRSDVDSAYGGSIMSETETIRSSVYEFIIENGRRFHSHSAYKYLLPSDESEQTRLDNVHYIFLLLLHGEICKSRLSNPQRVLDIGTGTGVWAIEFGDRYPGAHVTGVDLVPIQPSWVPPNVHFEIDDVTESWTYEAKFDFIHVRSLGGAFSDWPAFFQECYNNLEPGGQIEISEIRKRMWCGDGTFPEDSITNKWQNVHHELGRKMSKIFDISPLVPDWLRQAGFTEVEQTNLCVPIGTWPADKHLKEVGYCFRDNFLYGGSEVYTMALFTRSGWDPAEVRTVLNGVFSEITSNRMHVFSVASFTTARKPVLSDTPVTQTTTTTLPH